MTGKSLQGKRIVVTRPAAQAGSLCAAIESEGGIAIRFPVLAVAPVRDGSELETVCERLQEFDLAFFVSPNAVRFAMEFVLARGAWPSSLAVATVGKGSERELRRYGFSRIIAPDSGFDSESVLALPQFSAGAIAGKRVLVFRGDGGRTLLGATLVRRGATVCFVTAYRRFCPDLDARPLLEQARRGLVDAIVLTSSEGVGNFTRLVGGEGMQLLRRAAVFVPHARIAGFAREAGFVRVLLTPPGDDGVLEALRRELAP